MTAQHLDSDRFTAVFRGESRWTGAESAHIDRCPECRLEWQLVRAAGTLGRRSAEVDAAQAAGIVLQRLLREPVEPARRGSRRAGWMLAAAAAAVLAVAVLLRGGEPAPAPPAVAITMLHELDDLTPAELEAVLETIPPSAEEPLYLDAAPLGELSVADLERMLQAME
jgi:hypothetical protein